MKNTKVTFLVLLALGLITIGIHSYLSMQHYNLKLGLGAGPSVCNISATFNCDSVAASKYAQLFGIPMAILGAITQLILLILVLASQWELSSSSSTIRRLVFWISAFVAVVSVVMGTISTAVLGTYCIFCMAAYLLSWIYLFFAWKFQESKPAAHLGEDVQTLFGPLKWVLILLIAIPGFGYVANGVVLDSYGFGKMDMIIQDSVNNWEHSPVTEFSTTQGLVFREVSNPKMTIVEFADFMCPHCKFAYPPIHSFARSHNDVQFIFKSFPLDAKCNKGLTHEGDGYRCQLSAAVHCSDKLYKKGWEAHHWIFDNQETLPGLEKLPETLGHIATAVQGNADDLKKCMDEDSTLEAVQAAAAEGDKAKIQGTPSIFVNGKKLERGQFMPVLEAIYKKLN